MKNLTLKLSLLAAVILSVSACGHREFSQGEYDENVESENLMNDKWSETDMQQAVKTLVGSAMKHPAVDKARRPPIVMVTRLQNKTSEHIDTQSITDMVTVELVRTGKVQFVDKAARDDMADEYEYQKDNMSKDTMKSKGNQTGADLILNGRIDSIVQEVGKNKTVYYKVTLMMTNLSTGIITWTDQKQIRKKFRKKRVGL